ncbi:MAG: hypothetical protein V4687_13585 [Bacteroidota bacterium]
MKRISTSIFALIIGVNAFAQSNFHKISLGIGGGGTHTFTDVQKHDFALAGYGTFDYHFTPFFSLGAELQKGELAGGDLQSDPYERQFINKYMSATFNGKLALGAFIDYDRNGFSNFIKDLYIGAGAGFVSNKMKSIARYQESTGYKFPGLDNSTDVTFPFNLGINYYFKSNSGIPKVALNLNLQSNLTVGEGLDGYDDSSVKFKNNNPDIYNFYSIGLKYHFGQIGISKRNLN